MLDFTQVFTQIQTFANERADALPRLEAALREARRRLDASGPTWEETRSKISASKTSWLVASWHEPPDAVYAPPATPSSCTVFAADGSQIVSDRHDIALCYLLNIGLIALRYGTGERATLTSRPYLALPEDDLLDEFQGEQAAIVPKRLAIRRLLAEIEGLVELIGKSTAYSIQNTEEEFLSTINYQLSTAFSLLPPSSSLALFDGSLILWPLETEQEAFRAESILAFERLLEQAQVARVPIAGYISAPQSRDVVNALRVFQCPHELSNCDRYCPQHSKPRPEYVAPPCTGTESVRDADLFERMLQPGERSAVFGSRSQILQTYTPSQRIRFFYLHTGREVARVEIPTWVADDAELLALTHALCWDQARKGDGYPVALAEAHEQAIVRGAEKAAFFQMMQRAFVATGQPVSTTQKALSKRARRI